jgi:5S rRNA maturation endonuclease (ribonuclease M5)
MPVQPSLFDPPHQTPQQTIDGASPPSPALLAAARLHALLAELTLLNEEIPIIVEGARDITALRGIGLTGELIQLHCGQTLAAFAERISHAHPSVILLLDWDRNGRQLHTQLTRHLESDWEPYHYVRHDLIALCSPAISTVEELPNHVTGRRALLDAMPPRRPRP